MKAIIAQMGLRPAAKAWASAFTTAIAVGLALFGKGAMPPEAEVAAALIAAASGAASYAATWIVRNR